MPTNKEFLQVLFGDDLPWAHVTDFIEDPNNIPEDRHLICWKGDYFSRYSFYPQSNQYFTISTFYADEKGVARRRKALFRATHVITLDDVHEKLPIEEVRKLPRPTYILETSRGSEQWGYKLAVPETDRARVENLLDGLVANGLAPEGKDPGMKGVTRYVRLPEGVNNKASKLENGQPFQCRITEWNPELSVTLEDLATPFAVDLNAQRREGRIDGAAAVDDHPLLQIPDIIHIKEERSDGRYEITCPWVDEHTGEIDNGAAIFTNADGSIGFKCHHGACAHRTGADLIRYIDGEVQDFSGQLKGWKLKRSFEEYAKTEPTAQNLDFGARQSDPPPQLQVPADDPVQGYLDLLRSMHPGSAESRDTAAKILQHVDEYKPMDRMSYHDQVRDIMGWSKVDFKNILKELREEWYKESAKSHLSFFNEVIFVKELNQFYDRAKRIFYTPEAYQNSHSHLDEEARKSALQGDLVCKVDRLDYAPKMPQIFKENGITYGNSWSDRTEVQGYEGDVSCWLNHFDTLGWTKHKDDLINWMAYTLQHPEVKINHMILLGSPEGSGKDWLLWPLRHAMGDNHTLIDAEELLSGFQDWAIGTKYLHVNEAELGDRTEAKQVSNKIKPLAAAPPEYIRVNQKNIKPIRIRNLLSIAMTTNSQTPLTLNNDSRRILALWSNLNVRDEHGNMKPEWARYWKEAWDWMKNGGAEAVIYYLRHVVDVSNYNPGVPPPVTDFLRDIRDSSKSPMEQTIEAFIANRIGCFNSDLVTASDMVETFKAGPLIGEQFMYADHKYFTPARVGSIMRQMTSVEQLRARQKYDDLKVWALRDAHIYSALGPSQLYDEYIRQMKETKSRAEVRAVG